MRPFVAVVLALASGCAPAPAAPKAAPKGPCHCKQQPEAPHAFVPHESVLRASVTKTHL